MRGACDLSGSFDDRRSTGPAIDQAAADGWIMIRSPETDVDVAILGPA